MPQEYHRTVKLPLVSARERDTILAALRFYQANLMAMPEEFIEIAENDREGEDACLDEDEIDMLCMDINV